MPAVEASHEAHKRDASGARLGPVASQPHSEPLRSSRRRVGSHRRVPAARAMLRRCWCTNGFEAPTPGQYLSFERHMAWRRIQQHWPVRGRGPLFHTASRRIRRRTECRMPPVTEGGLRSTSAHRLCLRARLDRLAAAQPMPRRRSASGRAVPPCRVLPRRSDPARRQAGGSAGGTAKGIRSDSQSDYCTLILN